MPQSLARNAIHLIFSTKNRVPLIAPGLDTRLFAYMAGTLNELKCPALAVGGVADHVHLLFVLARTVSLSSAVEEVKEFIQVDEAERRPEVLLAGRVRRVLR